LKALQELKLAKLITNKEYQAKRASILETL